LQEAVAFCVFGTRYLNIVSWLMILGGLAGILACLKRDDDSDADLSVWSEEAEDHEGEVVRVRDIDHTSRRDDLQEALLRESTEE